MKVIKTDRIALLDLLKPFIDKGYPLDTHMFLYLSEAQGIYIYCGHSSTLDQSYIPLSDITETTVKLRCRKAAESEKKQNIKNCFNGNKTVRERKISEIIKKVTKWRKLYTGSVLPDAKTIKYTSKEAANLIGIAKKTLDDYLLQLRIGKKYGFDFNHHNDDKIGVLRSFIKERKGKMGRGEVNKS